MDTSKSLTVISGPLRKVQNWMKTRVVFICQQCGAESLKWMGKCPNCGEWNSLVETLTPGHRQINEAKSSEKILLQKLSQIKISSIKRIRTNINEVDRVLGGGIVPGSITLVAGEPGIGKSTLMLQLANKLPPPVFYVSGEESPIQIKLRAERLKIKGENIVFLAGTDVDAIIKEVAQATLIVGIPADKMSNYAPAVDKSNTPIVIVDSIQTLTTADMAGTAGSVGQVKECASRLQVLAKSQSIPVFLIGHVTKEGIIAGPKILEHLVDTVVYFEGDRYGSARLLRAVKNRFGPTDEVGVFRMTDGGLEEINNPSEIFLEMRGKNEPGKVAICTVEGTRPILAEIQALVVPTQLAIPRRVSQGIDYNRLQVIIAILSKSLHIPLANFDIYVSVAGGLRIEEPAADLAVALAIYSSFKNFPLPPKTVVFGELGLLGELRSVGEKEKRIKESKRLGFSNVISPEKYTTLKEIIDRLK